MKVECPHCHTYNFNNEEYCVGCGKKIKTVKVQEEKPKKKSKLSFKKFFIYFIIFLIIFNVGNGFYKNYTKLENSVKYYKKELLSQEDKYDKLKNKYSNVQSDSYNYLKICKEEVKNKEKFSFDDGFDFRMSNSDSQNLFNCLDVYFEKTKNYKDDVEKLEKQNFFSIELPITYVKNRTVYTKFIAPYNNNRYLSWSQSFDSYFTSLTYSKSLRDKNKRITEKYKGKIMGSYYDLREFVKGNPFNKVLDDYPTKDEKQLIYEMWEIVNQTTVYASDRESSDEPRTAVETMGAGGDCEDSSILLVSLIKGLNKNWDVYFVSVDSLHWTNPQKFNHVLVKVDTGNKIYYVESTANKNPFKSKPEGFEIKAY